MRLVSQYNLALIIAIVTANFIAVDVIEANPPSDDSSLPPERARPTAAPSGRVQSRAENSADALNFANKHSIEVNELLRRWEANSTYTSPVRARFSLSEFNHVFCVETISNGEFVVESSNRWRVDWKSIEIKKCELSKRLTKDGQPYGLESRRSGSWICTGDEILLTSFEEKLYSEETLLEHGRESELALIPFPLRLFLRPDGIRHGFKASVLKESEVNFTLLAIRENPKDAHASFFGTGQSFFQMTLIDRPENDSKLAITLDKTTHIPTQMRLLNLARVESVYKFESIAPVADGDSASLKREKVIESLRMQGFRDIYGK